MMHTMRERNAKWNERKGNGTAMSFGDRLLNECAGATTSCGSCKSSAYVQGSLQLAGSIGPDQPSARAISRDDPAQANPQAETTASE
jgi:hypothetical protein